MTRLWEEILTAVLNWRDEGYPDVSSTTRRLLEYWFEEEHRYRTGEVFEFWQCQREAMETIVYLYEVCEYESLYELSQGFDTFVGFDPTEDRWPKYCLKMATGSGKTFIMAQTIIWQYFNEIYGGDANSTNRFLLVAPNLIVYDRLLDGFAAGGVFQEFPFFIPEEWESDFDLQIIKRSSDVPPHGRGVLHVTNVQQLYERERDSSGDQPIQKLLQEEGGFMPTKGEEFKSRTHLKEKLSDYDHVLVLNDEAHHAHVETEWNNTLHDINGEEGRISLQLDFTATAWDIAREQQVSLPHIVYNYPLRKALEDGIVKEPTIVTPVDTPPPVGDDFVDQYQAEIHTAEEYLERRKEDLQDVEKKPVLFALCDNTEHANQVAEYFKNELGYGERVLLIHTYIRGGKYGSKGDVKRDQLEQVREAAKNIDDNEYEIVVSVLMLKEGWDVRNVSVILPMRAFGSDILTEQTLGRGLRRMFPHDEDASEDLYVIEHPSFESLWEEKIEQENLPIEVESPGEGYRESNRVFVDENKQEYDFEIPISEGGIKKEKPDLSQLDIESLPADVMQIGVVEVVEPKAIERDLISGETKGVRELEFDFAYSPQEYFAFLTKAVLKKSGSQSQFHELLPKIKNYTLERFFTERIEELDSETLSKLNSWEVRKRISDIFVQKLNELGKVEREYEISSTYRISDTTSFHTTKPVYQARKTVFNCLPYDSELERRFMDYLEDRTEVGSYTRLFWRIPIRINYFEEDKGRRYYIPDFIVSVDDKRYIVETKGEMMDETPTVEAKAKAARGWCENISRISETTWEYVKISQDEFEQNKRAPFEQMVSLVE